MNRAALVRVQRTGGWHDFARDGKASATLRDFLGRRSKGGQKTFARPLLHSTEVKDLSEGLEGLGFGVSAPLDLLHRQDHALLDQGLRAQAFQSLPPQGKGKVDLLVAEPNGVW